MLSNKSMDIDELRRTNICALEKEAGSPKKAAELVDMTYVQYLNYRNGAKETKTGKVRGMRKETAWRFEDAFNKPRGWLDQDHSSYLLPARDQAFVHRIEQEVARYDVPEHVKQAVITLITSSPLRHAGSSLAEHRNPRSKGRVICMREWRQRSMQAPLFLGN